MSEATLGVGTMDRTYLAECIEDVVEVDEDLALGHLGDVVHGLARIVPDTGILVREAGQNWRHDGGKVFGKLLCRGK